MKALKLMTILIIASSPLATAKTFESLGKTTSSMRLPSSAIKEAIEFDCATQNSELELSTQQETIRVVGKHCPKDMTVQHMQFQQSLHSFPAADDDTMTSEFAYLRKGENHIEVQAGAKHIRLKIFRY